MRQLSIEYDHCYASISVSGSDRYWVELEGSVWVLRTGNGFNNPVKTWRRTDKRNRIEAVLSEAIAVVTSRLESWQHA